MSVRGEARQARMPLASPPGLGVNSNWSPTRWTDAGRRLETMTSFIGRPRGDGTDRGRAGCNRRARERFPAAGQEFSPAGTGRADCRCPGDNFPRHYSLTPSRVAPRPPPGWLVWPGSCHRPSPLAGYNDPRARPRRAVESFMVRFVPRLTRVRLVPALALVLAAAGCQSEGITSYRVPRVEKPP